MKNQDNNTTEKSFSQLVQEGMELTMKRLVKTKKERNLPVVVSENGKIRYIDPKDL